MAEEVKLLYLVNGLSILGSVKELDNGIVEVQHGVRLKSIAPIEGQMMNPHETFNESQISKQEPIPEYLKGFYFDKINQSEDVVGTQQLNG